MPDEEHELLERIRGATDGITARPDSVGMVRARVRARRRRRTAWGAGVTAAIAVVATAVVVDWTRSDDGSSPGPADRSEDPPSAIEGDLFRPAGFFEDVVGGKAAPRQVTHRLTRGEKFFALVDWWPTDPRSTPSPYLVDIALERIEGSPAEVCADLGPGSCESRGGGHVAHRYELPAREAFLDPVHRRAPVEVDAADALVRGVTYVRADGWAVSVLVCNCSATGDVLGGTPPLAHDRLEEVAASDTWIRAK